MYLTASHGLAAQQLLLSIENGEQENSPTFTSAEARTLRGLGFFLGRDSVRLRDDARLLKLLVHFDAQLGLVRSLDNRVWLAYMEVVTPQQKNSSDTFVGKGFAPANAIRGCLGELAEFRSWCYRPGDTECSLALAQFDRFTPWPITEKCWQALGTDPRARSSVDWVYVQPLRGGEPRLAPAFLCLGRYGDAIGMSQPELNGDSNGCASATDLSAARLVALLELIERDATGIWWYSGCQRPAYVPDGSAGWLTSPQRLARGRTLWFLDLTTDLRVPVVAAISTDANGFDPALGVAARLSRAAAAEAAYLELAQSELGLSLTRSQEPASEHSHPAVQSRYSELLDWYSEANRRHLAHLVPSGLCDINTDSDIVIRDSVENQLDEILQQLAAAGISAYWRDLTRSELNVPVVRVLAPGLAHYKKCAPSQRLTSVPIALRWREETFSSDDLLDFELKI